MKKKSYLNITLFLGVLFLLMMIALSSRPTMAQSQSNQDTIVATKEYVDVVNVEMIMRVMRNGEPLNGLQQSDFTITENGKPIEMTSFTEIRRKIGERDMIQLEGHELEEPKNRFFLLYFWIADRNIDYQTPLDYFFNDVYREGDSVILMAQNNAYRISKSEDIKPARKQLEAQLKKITSQLHGTYLNAISSMSSAFDDFLEAVSRKIPDAKLINKFRQNITRSFSTFFNTYRRQYLNTNVKQLLRLAETLKDIPMEKWGIVFFQQSSVPYFDVHKVAGRLAVASDISPDGIVSMLSAIEKRIQRPMTSIGHIAKLQQAFLRADATFHMMIPRGKLNDKGYSDLMQLSDTYSDWQESFGEIANATGGDIIKSNMMKTSLKKVVEREDVYYRITYKPHNLESKTSKIRIHSKLKDAKIFHISKVDAQPLQNIQLSGVSYNDDTLSLTIKNYHRIRIGDQDIGDVQLVITAGDENGDVVEFMKKLELKGEDAQISMKTKFPQQGQINVMVTAWDNFSGLKAQQTLNINN